ncbi:ATP-binding cassette domain-containing protein [Planococcus sp. CAU13]|uniref:ATP-binding cassette domain-containing protein n=1 Tax=Planococcus sp. CAU13 TaxID=1541197 RepID=UPI00052FDAFD|nr:ABC transporter ATP-binding protein [Planococcus sp. CAU13]
MSSEIKLQDVSLTFKKFEALKNLTLTFEAGKIHGLIGRNGAGKTSLLSLIAAFREPSAGNINIDGKEVFENSEIMQKVMFVYDKNYDNEYDTIPSVLEITESFRANFNKEYADYLIKRFKLPIDKPVYKLSKGMKSAMNVVIGLASRAEITIFDEAYLGMDAPAREIFYQEILADQAKHPRTFILSTHLVSEMDYLFDNVVIIDQGKLLLNEDYETVISRGASITGAADQVDAFAADLKILNEQKLGGTKKVMVYGALEEDRLSDALQSGIEIGPVSLQDLFIHLTEEEH